MPRMEQADEEKNELKDQYILPRSGRGCAFGHVSKMNGLGSIQGSRKLCICGFDTVSAESYLRLGVTRAYSVTPGWYVT